jgi:hypothetical protein
MGLTEAAPPLAAWGLSADLIPLPGGHRNTVLRTTGDGPAWVFKTTRRDMAALAWLTPVQDAARAAGLEAPRLRPGLRGHLRENGWTCEPFVAGTPLSAADMPCLAPALSLFHGTTGAMPQRPGFRAARDLLEMDTGGDIDLTVMPPDIAAACRAVWRVLLDTPVAAIHGDLNPANILRTPSGALCLLDWDEARVDAPLFDGVTPKEQTPEAARARLAWEIACSLRVEQDHARALLPALSAA